MSWFPVSNEALIEAINEKVADLIYDLSEKVNLAKDKALDLDELKQLDDDLDKASEELKGIIEEYTVCVERKGW